MTDNSESFIFRFPIDIDEHLRRLKNSSHEVKRKYASANTDLEYFNLYKKLVPFVFGLRNQIYQETDYTQTNKVVMEFVKLIRTNEWSRLFLFREEHSAGCIDVIFNFLLADEENCV